MTKFQKKRHCWILSSTTARAGANSKWSCEYLRDERGVFHSHPYHIMFSQQGISRYMVWWCIYPARQGGGQEDLSINSRRGTTGATKRGPGWGVGSAKIDHIRFSDLSTPLYLLAQPVSLHRNLVQTCKVTLTQLDEQC